MEEGFKRWSNVSNWPDNKLPEDGANVTIKLGERWLLDIAKTPKLHNLTIEGLLIIS